MSATMGRFRWVRGAARAAGCAAALAACGALGGCEDTGESATADQGTLDYLEYGETGYNHRKPTGEPAETPSLNPELDARDHQFLVQVLNVRNQPVPGAAVIVDMESYGQSLSATDGSGQAQFGFFVPPNLSVAITAQSTGYQSGTVITRTGSGGLVDVPIVLADW